MSEQRGPDGEQPPSVDAGNSINLEVSTPDTAVADLSSALVFAKYCISFDNATFKELLNTWCILETVTWESEKHSVGDPIFQRDFPSYVIDKLRNYPQLLPFKMYQYWRGDIEIRATVAGSPFAIGQCQMWWYYDKFHDASFAALRSNKYSRSQMMHVLLDPSAPNDAVLYIKFRAYRSFLNTREIANRGQGPALNLGTLGIHVLNKLQVPNECTSNVNIVLHVRFPNSSFQGRVYAY